MSYKYQKEYEEALSRLNAPERTPLPYTPLPYGPVPNKCNYMNWNRIMAETRQGVLPKYSILQRIDLSSQNDLVMVSDAKEYTYTLDPSFTFAKGARKSIAVRAVDIYNVIPNGQSKIAREYFQGRLSIKYKKPVETTTYQTVTDTKTGVSTTKEVITKKDVEFVVQLDLSNFSFTCSNDIAVSLNDFARSLGQMLYTNTEEATNGNGLLNPDFVYAYIPATKKITIEFTSNPDNNWTITGTTSGALTQIPRWEISHSEVYDIYNVAAGHEDIRLSPGKVQYKNAILYELE